MIGSLNQFGDVFKPGWMARPEMIDNYSEPSHILPVIICVVIIIILILALHQPLQVPPCEGESTLPCCSAKIQGVDQGN